MFNETFWFFYWVNVASGLAALAVSVFILTMIATGFAVFFAGLEEELDTVKPWLKKLALPLLIGSAVLAVFMPPEEAFYGGATQYVAQSTELDDTLLKLKSLVDAKLEQLGVDDDTSSTD